MTVLDELKNRIATLLPTERADLRDWLAFQEAEVDEDDPAEKARLDVVEARYREYKAGRVKSYSAEEVDRHIVEKYGLEA